MRHIHSLSFASALFLAACQDATPPTEPQEGPVLPPPLFTAVVGGITELPTLGGASTEAFGLLLNRRAQPLPRGGARRRQRRGQDFNRV